MNRREFVTASAGLVLFPGSIVRRRTLALVTADLEARLVVVDVERGRVVGHVPTLPSPRSIERVGSLAVVMHSDSGVVSVVDGLVVSRVIRGLGEPRYAASHPDGRHVFVTDAARGEVVVLDAVQGTLVGRVAVGARARHVTIDSAGRTLWVALGSKAREVAVVDVSRKTRPRLVQCFEPPFAAHDVAFAPDRRHVWVTSGDRDELAVYDPGGRLLARPWGQSPPQHVTFGPDFAYVSSGWAGSVRLHRPDGRLLATRRVPIGSYNIQYGPGVVVTPSLGHGDLAILDSHGRTRHHLVVARSSHDACLL